MCSSYSGNGARRSRAIAARSHYSRTTSSPATSSRARFEVFGHLDDAVAEFRKLTHDPRTRLQALVHITAIKPAAIAATEQAEMTAGVADPDTPYGLRVGLYFALGELLERQGRYEDSFAAFATGNRMRREKLAEPVEHDPRPEIAPPSTRVRAEHPDMVAERHRDAVARNIALFTPELFARHREQGHASRAPIFILGMPRSGSTLLEQILSSHGKVEGLGECAALWEAVRGKYPYDASARPAAVDQQHFRRLADDYLMRLRRFGWGKSPRVIDKMLGNYMHIGMIHLMFPHAIILHSVRDPVDNCLAYFRKLFRTGNELSYDLRDIGAQYVRYRQMMAHWEAVLPGRIVSVSHEELVDDPDGRIRWLVEDACGLKWDDACLNFHQTKRAVRTASVAQVRQPIFSTSVARWRRYARHLGPLFDALGPYAPTEYRTQPEQGDTSGALP